MPTDNEQQRTPPRKDVRVALSLRPELYKEFEMAAAETETPVSVLIRQWAVEKLRQRQREHTP